MINVFVSYSHEDEFFREELAKHLVMLQRQGIIRVWHDRKIGAGKDIHGEISENLEAADVVLLLVSPDFLASDYCYDRELARAMERHREGSARVVPVIIRVCDWHGAPFGDLKAVPRDGQPITKFVDRDEGFNEVAKAIRDVATEPGSGTAEPSYPPPLVASPESRPTPSARPAGMRLKKKFTDLDRDRFIEEAFESIANQFKESLAALKEANPGIDTNFRRIDANHFSAKVYVQGKEGAHCRIWFGGRTALTGGILYSSSDLGDNSYNESLSVTDDGYSLFLKPIGLAFRPDTGNEQMTAEDAAEYYWNIFIEPLKR